MLVPRPSQLMKFAATCVAVASISLGAGSACTGTTGDEPEPSQPEPSQPEPSQPEPNQPEPSQPEPTAPTPEPTAPAPEPTAPAPEPTAPAPEPTPTPEPTPEPNPGCAYPGGIPADGVMELNATLPQYSWPTSLDFARNDVPLDMANVPCDDDATIDWSPFDVLLFVSIPAW